MIDTMPLISLVIPVFNSKKHLDKCIKSIFKQTYYNFEIILIDDGSTDGCDVLCDSFATQDSRVKVYHKKNEGQSVARNFGVMQAKGEYVTFVDSDDIISESYLSYLYYLIDKYNSDISCAGIKMINKENDVEKSNSEYSKDELVFTEKALKMMCQENLISVSPCAKLYKKSILVKHPYPSGRIYEDLATTCKILGECSEIAIGYKTIYYYIQRENSTTRHLFDEKYLDALLAVVEQLEYIRVFFPEAEREAKARCASVAIALISRPGFFINKKQAKSYLKQIKFFLLPFLKDALRDNSKGFVYKMRCLVVFFGYYPTKMFWMIVDEIKKMQISRGGI